MEGITLLQAIWNFAEFRYIATAMDTRKVRKLIEYAKPIASEFGQFESEMLDKEKQDKIVNLFNEVASPISIDHENKVIGVIVNEKRLREIELKEKRRWVSFGATGASKFLHLLNPNFFVMWDKDIRGGNDKRKDGYYNEASEYFRGTEMVDSKGEYRKFRSDGIGYLEFLTAVKSTFVDKNDLNVPNGYPHTFAKAIDQFNFSLLHLKE